MVDENPVPRYLASGEHTSTYRCPHQQHKNCSNHNHHQRQKLLPPLVFGSWCVVVVVVAMVMLDLRMGISWSLVPTGQVVSASLNEFIVSSIVFLMPKKQYVNQVAFDAQFIIRIN